MHTLHVTATMRLCHAALRGMTSRNRGGIINVSSVAAFVRRAGGASYGATKGWIGSPSSRRRCSLNCAPSSRRSSSRPSARATPTRSSTIPCGFRGIRWPTRATG
jgi:NADP-dependent 3-hydroxy acid dehydrogenase YdfG